MLAALAVSALLLAGVFARVKVRTDLADFLPAGRTPAARAMMAELRHGAGTALVLIGVEGTAAPELARTSRALAEALGETGLFLTVAGGEAALDEATADRLFAWRYLLSPAVRPEVFEVGALRDGLLGVLRGLGGSASPLVSRYGLPDPTGAFPALLRRLAPAAALDARDGAWFAPDRPPDRQRAILIAVLRANGLEMAAQDAALDAVAGRFAAVAAPGTRLLLAGPVVMARDAARAIRADVTRISVVSTLAVAALLAWRFRSGLVVAAIAVPVVLSVAAAVAITATAFGGVHGVALGFGLTMLGISVDYPVLLIGHRKRGEAAPATRARIGPAFRLAVATATLGLGGLLLSGFPGLIQLGAFAAVGLVVAAAATWWLLPPLVIAANLAPVAAGEGSWQRRIEAWRRYRLAAWALAGLAGVALAVSGGPRWERQLARLSPVPKASLALDAELRGAVGAADAGQLVYIGGADPQAVLRRQESLLPRLDALVASGALAGYDAAAAVLPSAALQSARQAALPSTAQLQARLAVAMAGLPFRPAALDAFRAAVGTARTLTPVLPKDLAGSALGARLAPLLFAQGDGWNGPILLRGLTRPAELAATLAAAPWATRVDVQAELDGMLADQLGRAGWWLGGSAAAILLSLAVGLRRAGRVLRVAGAVAAAQVVTVACLTVAGVRLSPIHFTALLLSAGVGLDYALFVARERLDREERARTLRTLVTCNAMTLLTFGLLATCATPLLRDIGITVALGAGLSLGFAFLLAAPTGSAA